MQFLNAVDGCNKRNSAIQFKYIQLEAVDSH